MRLGDKVARILGEQNRSKRWLSGLVKLTPTAVSNIIKGADTSYAVAERISRVLHVDAGWLIDDAADWPPPASEGFSGIPDSELIETLGARLSRAGATHKELLDEARSLLDAKKRGQRPPDYGDRASRLMERLCASRPIYFGLLECLVETGKRIHELDDLVYQLVGIRLNWVSPSEEVAAGMVLRRVKDRYAEAEALWPSVVNDEVSQSVVADAATPIPRDRSLPRHSQASSATIRRPKRQGTKPRRPRRPK